jgi:hypothetical protein
MRFWIDADLMEQLSVHAVRSAQERTLWCLPRDRNSLGASSPFLLPRKAVTSAKSRPFPAAFAASQQVFAGGVVPVLQNIHCRAASRGFRGRSRRASKRAPDAAPRVSRWSPAVSSTSGRRRHHQWPHCSAKWANLLACAWRRFLASYSSRRANGVSTPAPPARRAASRIEAAPNHGDLGAQ